MTSEMQAWFDGRPECVKVLFREFPPGTAVGVEGTTHYVIGYNERDMLILSPVDPYEDYDGAQEEKIYVCAAHLRNTVSATGDT